MTFASPDRDDAVAPVVGVILMVAITIVLGSVIAVFVFNVPGKVEPEKSASFAVDYQENVCGSSDSQHELTLIHENGDRLDPERVYVRGEGLGNATDENWLDAGGEYDASSSRIILGNSISICGVDSDFDLRLTYDAGDSSTTLQEEQGPAA